MKQNLSFLFSFLLIIVNAQKSLYHLPSTKTDVAKNDLKGNVKSVLIKEWEVVVKFGDPVKDVCISKEEIFFTKDSRRDKSSYEYENGEARRTRSYTYNAANKITEIKTSYTNNKVEIQEFLYNPKNQLVEINFYYDRQKLYGKDKYSYDENGLMSIIKYNGDGNFDGQQIYKWDSQSRMITENTWDYKKRPVTLFDFKYDEKGNVIWQGETTQSSGTTIPVSQTEFTYNTKDQRIKMVKKFESAIDSSETFYTYDSYGNILTEIEKYRSKKSPISKYTYTYTYDSNGNWLTKLSEDEDKDYELIEREIKYW